MQIATDTTTYWLYCKISRPCIGYESGFLDIVHEASSRGYSRNWRFYERGYIEIQFIKFAQGQLYGCKSYKYSLTQIANLVD